MGHHRHATDPYYVIHETQSSLQKMFLLIVIQRIYFATPLLLIFPHLSVSSSLFWCFARIDVSSEGTRDIRPWVSNSQISWVSGLGIFTDLIQNKQFNFCIKWWWEYNRHDYYFMMYYIIWVAYQSSEPHYRAQVWTFSNFISRDNISFYTESFSSLSHFVKIRDC